MFCFVLLFCFPGRSGIVKSRLAESDCKEKGWLLDGFPRTGVQVCFILFFLVLFSLYLAFFFVIPRSLFITPRSLLVTPKSLFMLFFVVRFVALAYHMAYLMAYLMTYLMAYSAYTHAPQAPAAPRLHYRLLTLCPGAY